VFLVALAALLIALALGGCGGGGGDDGGRAMAGAADRSTTSTPAKPASEHHRRPRARHLTISVSGDLLIHSPVWERALALGGGGSYDFAPLFARLRPYVERPDLAICHVETPMSPAAPASYPIFNTPPALAKGVAATGWDACDTASNHSVDQGAQGIAATGEALDDAGVRHTGSFASEAARGRPLILNDHGVKVAYLAYTTDTNGIPPPHSWSVNLAGPERILDDARAARKAGADAVIVNLHWGGGIVAEYSSQPSKAQIALAARLTDSPAVTAIVGQGPHVVQPIWLLHDKYVLFSEGNLVSNQGSAAGLPAASQDGYVGLLDLVVRRHESEVEGVGYVPVWVSHPDYTVLPIGDALASGTGDAALRASYERTVSVAGRGTGVEVEPDGLP
jgi:poly-gamma-glutamate synthesis protein (capsule biosynthesis protein)